MLWSFFRSLSLTFLFELYFAPFQSSDSRYRRMKPSIAPMLNCDGNVCGIRNDFFPFARCVQNVWTTAILNGTNRSSMGLLMNPLRIQSSLAISTKRSICVFLREQKKTGCTLKKEQWHHEVSSGLCHNSTLIITFYLRTKETKALFPPNRSIIILEERKKKKIASRWYHPARCKEVLTEGSVSRFPQAVRARSRSLLIEPFREGVLLTGGETNVTAENRTAHNNSKARCTNNRKFSLYRIAHHTAAEHSISGIIVTNVSV